MFKKVIYNTSSQLIAKLVSASITLLVTILIGRNLGEAGFGDFTKIFVFIGYFYTFSDFGLNAIYVKITKTPQEQISNLKVLLGTRLVLTTFLAALAILISQFLPYNHDLLVGFSPLVKTGIILTSLTIITQGLLTTANAFFQKNLRYDLSALSVIFGYLVVLIATIIASVTQKGLLAYTAAYIYGGITFVLAAYLFIYKKVGKIILPHFSLQRSFELIKNAWPIGTALILNLIYFRIDIFILSSSRSSAEVGIYGLAYQFFEASLAVPIFFANTLYPVLTNSYHQNLGIFKKEVRFWLKILLAVSIALAIFLFVIANFIPLIYEGRFGGSVAALQILALGMPFFFISALLWHLLILYNRQKFLILIYGSGAAFNLIANLIFIPVYGYLAAAIITVFSEALVLLLLVVCLLKFNKS